MNEKILRRAVILILIASGAFVLVTAQMEKNDGRTTLGRYKAGSETYTREENESEFESAILKKRAIGFILMGLGATTIFVWKKGTNSQKRGAIQSR